LPGLDQPLRALPGATRTCARSPCYDRLAGWVSAYGTLLSVGHLHAPGHGHRAPADASVTLSDVVAGLDPAKWEVVTADERVRTVASHGDHVVQLNDVVVRATRR
jgi:hypothetical protein